MTSGPVQQTVRKIRSHEQVLEHHTGAISDSGPCSRHRSSSSAALVTLIRSGGLSSAKSGTSDRNRTRFMSGNVSRVSCSFLLPAPLRRLSAHPDLDRWSTTRAVDHRKCAPATIHTQAPRMLVARDHHRRGAGRQQRQPRSFESAPFPILQSPPRPPAIGSAPPPPASGCNAGDGFVGMAFEVLCAPAHGWSGSEPTCARRNPP